METDNLMKPDKDCFVRPLGVNDYFICRSKDSYRNKCPYIMDYFCNYPDRHHLPQLLLPADAYSEDCRHTWRIADLYKKYGTLER